MPDTSLAQHVFQFNLILVAAIVAEILDPPAPPSIGWLSAAAPHATSSRGEARSVCRRRIASILRLVAFVTSIRVLLPVTDALFGFRPISRKLRQFRGLGVGDFGFGGAAFDLPRVGDFIIRRAEVVTGRGAEPFRKPFLKPLPNAQILFCIAPANSIKDAVALRFIVEIARDVGVVLLRFRLLLDLPAECLAVKVLA